MVFHDKRKRKGRAPTTTKPHITINDLPDELILNVLEHVDTHSILKLRETGRSMVPVATTALRERLKTLYVHPSKTSVRRAIAICNSDLSSEIEEVCFVNKVVWEKLRRQDFRNIYVQQRMMHRGKYTCPWPGRFALTKKQEESIHMDDGSKTFETVYEVLLSSLSLCPKMQAFSVEEECIKPGFNMTSKTLVYESSWAGRSLPHSKERAAEDRLYERGYTPSKGKKYFTDVEAILSILLHPDIKLSRLSIAQDFSNAYEIHRRLVSIEEEPQRVLRAKMAGLTRLDLHCTALGSMTSWQLACGHLVKAAASKLRHLSLSFSCNAHLRRIVFEESLRAIIDGIAFPVLERLELRAFPSRRKHSKGEYIPLLQHYDLANFLARQSASYGKLRVLASSNVLAATNAPDVSKEDLIKQMHEVLENANVKFEWTEEKF